MSLLDLGEVAQLLAAGGLGGVVTNLVLGARERREGLARARSALQVYQNSRTEELREAYVSAALLGGVPRRLVYHYLAAQRRETILGARHHVMYRARKKREEESGVEIPKSEDERSAYRAWSQAGAAQIVIFEVHSRMLWSPLTTRLYWRPRVWFAVWGQMKIKGPRIY